MTILEALILGQPVVSTDNDGAKAILREGETGLLCKIDARSLANTIHELVQDPQRLARLRESVAAADMDEGNRAILDALEKLL